MINSRKRLITVMMAAILIMMQFAGAVYADQPYRGTTKHKRTLRNADIGRAPREYTDIDGETRDADRDTVSISFTSDMEQDLYLYSRVSTYFKAESGHYPRSFLIDAGNYSAGAPFNSVFAQYYPGVSAMGAAGYDIAGIGSSEVSQGGKNLAAMLENAAKSGDTLPYITSGNIAGTEDLEDAYKKYGVNDYLDMNKYRTEIAVFSLVGEDAYNAAAPDKLRYENAVKEARKLVAEIKKDEDPDIIMCICSSGTGAADSEKKLEKKIAGSVEGIDIIVSSGSATELDKPVKVGDTRIFSLAAGGSSLGRIEYKIEDNKYRYSGYSTVELDDTYKKDSAVTKKLDKIAKVADKNYFAANGYASGQVLCSSFFTIAPMIENAGKKGDSPLGEFIADAYRYAATEDAKIPKGNLVAVASDVSALSGINEGKVRVNDIYDMMAIGKADDGSKGHALTSFYLSGADLKILAEIAATAAEDPSARRIYFSGLNYKYNPNRFKESRIYDITVLEDATGSQIELNDSSSYRIIADKATAAEISSLTNADGTLYVTPKDADGNETDVFEELKRSMDKDKALKSWIAVSEYAFSFSEAGIPATYKKPDGRMVYDESKAVSHVYKGELFTLIQLLIVALIGVAALIMLILLVLNLAGVQVGKKGRKTKK